MHNAHGILPKLTCATCRHLRPTQIIAGGRKGPIYLTCDTSGTSTIADDWRSWWTACGKHQTPEAATK
jgi:hypothetical protein